MSPTTIVCEDCSAKRHNPRFKNTRYCNSDRLLRDLLYVAAEQRPCADCKKLFAPVSRKDTLCGRCYYGSIHTGWCFACDNHAAELHRPGIPVCGCCLREPANRKRIVAGLRKGQAERRLANNHPVA